MLTKISGLSPREASLKARIRALIFFFAEAAERDLNPYDDYDGEEGIGYEEDEDEEVDRDVVGTATPAVTGDGDGEADAEVGSGTPDDLNEEIEEQAAGEDDDDVDEGYASGVAEPEPEPESPLPSSLEVPDSARSVGSKRASEQGEEAEDEGSGSKRQRI